MLHHSFNARGIPVHTSFYSNEEPAITHGALEIENLDDQVIHISVRQVKLQAGDDVVLINPFFVYQLPDYNEKDPKNIQQPPLVTTQYDISFLRLSAAPYLNITIQIEIELEVNGEVIILHSPYTISRRTSRNISDSKWDGK
jgi:hypothetical protein